MASKSLNTSRLRYDELFHTLTQTMPISSNRLSIKKHMHDYRTHVVLQEINGLLAWSKELKQLGIWLSYFDGQTSFQGTLSRSTSPCQLAYIKTHFDLNNNPVAYDIVHDPNFIHRMSRFRQTASSHGRCVRYGTLHKTAW